MVLNEQQQRELGKTLRQLAEQLDSPIVTPPSPVPLDLKPVGINDPTLKLVWHDEFDGTWPDLVNWHRGEREKADGNHKAPGDNTEREFYQVDQVTEHDSVLELKASRRTVKVIKIGESDVRKNRFIKASGTDGDPDIFYWPYYEGVYKYQSGWASTGPDQYGDASNGWKFRPSLHEFLYGVFEFRVKLPKGRGYWGAAWMLRSDRGGPEEIDLYEVVDPEARKMAHHYHCLSVPDWTKDSGMGRDTGVDLSAGFHTISIDWMPNYIRWYFDGTLVQTTEGSIDPANICKHPMYIILNLAIGGAWPMDPDATTPFPQSMLVDYARVWSRA